MRRLGVVIILLLAAGVSLSFAGGQKEAAEEKVSLDFWSLADPEKLEDLVAEFNTKHPNVQIKLTTYGDPAITEALNAAAASGTGPDLFRNWGGELQYALVRAGFVADISSSRQKYKWAERVIPTALGLSTYNGKLYGVPFSYNCMTVFYRKDIFDRFALKPPKTYNELLEINKKLKAGGVTPFATAGKFGWHPAIFMDALFEKYAGAQLHDKLNLMEVSWNSKAIIDSYAEVKRWIDNGWFNENFISLSPDEVFMPLFKGDVAMIYQGVWIEPAIVQAGLALSLFDTFAFPFETGRLDCWIDQYAVGAKTKHPEKALQFIDYVLDLDIASRYYTGVSSSLQGFKKDPAKEPLAARSREILNQAKGSFLPSDTVLPFDVVHTIFEVQDQVFSGAMTAQQAAARIQQSVEEAKGKR
jgi:raffinose/stachyose/melibiose transport system substrate-binding protein